MMMVIGMLNVYHMISVALSDSAGHCRTPFGDDSFHAVGIDLSLKEACLNAGRDPKLHDHEESTRITHTAMLPEDVAMKLSHYETVAGQGNWKRQCGPLKLGS